jgi:hypothetical protein
MNSEQNNSETERVYLIKPLWHFIFFLLGLIILFLIGIPVWFFTGLSSSDDRVFAVEALIAGFLTEFVIKKWFHKELYLFPKLNFRFYYFWIILSLYVFFYQPFE